MRVRDRQQGLQGGEDSSEANAEQNARTDATESNSILDTLFEFESIQSKNRSPSNEFDFGNSIASVNWTPEGVPIGQISLEETLEEELTSGVLENSSLSYIKTKAHKLENAIREVNRECDNLIAVCDPPEEDLTSQLSAGMLAGPSDNATSTPSKRMLVMASVALLATCGVVYGYVSPQNPIKLTMQSKAVTPAGLSVTETIIKPSKNVYASLGDFLPPSQPLTTHVEKAEKPPTEQSPLAVESNDVPKDKVTPTVSISKPMEVKIANAPIVREIIPQARQSRASQLEVTQITASATSATEAVGLSERFGQGVTLRAIQPAAPAVLNTNTPRTSAPQLAPPPKEEIKLQVSAPVKLPKRRDRKVVEKLVLQANARATLDNSQVRILVARLAQGDCLFSALHGIFGENKISPTFVHTLFTGMENKC